MTSAGASGPPSPRDVLVVAGVSRAFSGVQALSNVSLALRTGEVLGLIGPNGAGKSTLVNIISGYDVPDSGTVTMHGRDITRSRARARSRMGVARTFQHGHLFSGLTVRENLEVAALATGRSRRQAGAEARDLLDATLLGAWAEHSASALPHGVERRVGVARALATRPTVLLLDEPAAGLNEGEIGQFGDSVRALAEAQGIGVLLIDHNMALIMSVCSRIHVVVQGSNFLEGTPDEVRNSDALIEAYLGRSGHVPR